METSKKLLAFLAAVVVAVVGIAAYRAANTESDDALNSPTPSVAAATFTPTPLVLRYKDGTYTAVGDYTNPAGAEKIDVTLTIKDDVIVDANVVSTTTHPTSKLMQAKFISGYKPLVIGKKIDDVVLTKVSGSSLTPVGFNNAVAKIKVQAS